MRTSQFARKSFGKEFAESRAIEKVWQFSHSADSVFHIQHFSMISTSKQWEEKELVCVKNITEFHNNVLES